MISFGLDVVTGAVTLGHGRSVGFNTTVDEAVAMFGTDADGIELEGDSALIEVKGVFAGRTFDVVTFRFDTDEKLIYVSFGEQAATAMKWLREGDSGRALLRARENRDLMRSFLGPPRYETAQWSRHVYPWGFVVSGAYRIRIEYPWLCATCKKYLRRCKKAKFNSPTTQS